MAIPQGITVVFDATHSNIGSLPAGAQAAGYVTGTPDIQWTEADWNAHPGAVRIDQSPVNTPANELADVLDVEAGAATLADVVPWFKAALANYQTGVRPGQRRPAIYTSQSNVTNVANALVAGGITKDGPGLWIANWSLTEANAAQSVLAAAGPYPIVGVQFTNNGLYDTSVFLTQWLNTVSVTPPPESTALLGIVCYIQEGFRANTSDFVSKRVTSLDNGITWH